MNTHEIINRDRVTNGAESGFTVLEVSVASVITIVSLVFLASLFSLSISQNRMVKQFTASTALAQEKMEELNAIDKNDDRIRLLGGGLDSATQEAGYWEEVTLPGEQVANYIRRWQVAADPVLTNTRVISVRVVAMQASIGKRAEGTTLVSIRSW
jgi:hypothetical protein